MFENVFNDLVTVPLKLQRVRYQPKKVNSRDWVICLQIFNGTNCEFELYSAQGFARVAVVAYQVFQSNCDSKMKRPCLVSHSMLGQLTFFNVIHYIIQFIFKRIKELWVEIIADKGNLDGRKFNSSRTTAHVNPSIYSHKCTRMMNISDFTSWICAENVELYLNAKGLSFGSGFISTWRNVRVFIVSITG